MSTSLLAVGAAVLIWLVNSTAPFVIAGGGFVVFTNIFSATRRPVLGVVLAVRVHRC